VILVRVCCRARRRRRVGQRPSRGGTRARHRLPAHAADHAVRSHVARRLSRPRRWVPPPTSWTTCRVASAIRHGPPRSAAIPLPSRDPTPPPGRGHTRPNPVVAAFASPRPPPIFMSDILTQYPHRGKQIDATGAGRAPVAELNTTHRRPTDRPSTAYAAGATVPAAAVAPSAAICSVDKIVPAPPNSTATNHGWLR
jgi:hypothetical protein